MSPSTWLSRLALLLVVGGLAAALGVGAVLAAGPAGPAALGGEGQPAIVGVPNTTSYLQPAGASTERRAYSNQGVDVGAAVAEDVAGLRASHDRRTLAVELEAASDRNEVLRRQLADVEARTAELRSAQRAARGGYLDGELSRDALLQRLARVDGRAAALQTVRSAIEDRAGSLPGGGDGTLTRAQNLEAALEIVGGPATRRVRERLTGDRDAGATYVSVVGSHGLVVATVADDSLYRDALDATERDPNGTSQFAGTGEPEISVALQRAAALYPWAFEHGGAAQPLRGYGDTAVYRISAEHPQGRVSAYLDGATENVFREIQEKRVAAVPVVEQRRATGDDLVVRLNTTHETGPLGVTVTRESTGRPVDASVTIDGDAVGATGREGRLWTVQPRGAATVTVRTDEDEVVTIELG